MDHLDGLMQLACGRELRDMMEPSLGPFCHQFRNRLNSIKLAVYLARRQAVGELERSWESLERDYQAIEDRLDRVQKVCRDADLARVAIDLNLLFDDRASQWADSMARAGAHLAITAPREGCPTRVDVARLGSALDDLALWRAAARSGPREVLVAWNRVDGRTTITWRESYLESAVGEAEATDPGRTWTFPILARLMADHAGTLSWSEGPGWELTLGWPG